MQKIKFPFILHAMLLLFVNGLAQNKQTSISAKQFGYNADFVRLKISLKSSWASSSNYSFLPTDTGKILAIKNARSYSQYSNLPLAVNAIITQVKNGKALIQSPDKGQILDNDNTDANFGTNNFDAIQNALDYCFNNKIPTIDLPTGTAYMVPYLSKICAQHLRNDAGNISGLIVRGTVQIRGQGKDKTKLKVGGEDLVYINNPDAYKYDLFYLEALPGGALETKSFSNFTIEAPDRGTTAIWGYNYAFRTTYADDHLIKAVFDGVDIFGSLGFEGGFTTSRGGRWNTDGTVQVFCEYEIKNCNWKCGMPVTVYAQVPAKQINVIIGAKKLLIQNAILDGGGVKIKRKFIKAATLSNGILSVQQNGFSFYDYNGYLDGDNRNIPIQLQETIEATVVDFGPYIDMYTKVLKLNTTLPLGLVAADLEMYAADGSPVFLRQSGNTDADRNILRLRTSSYQLYDKVVKLGAKVKIFIHSTFCNTTQILGPTTAKVDVNNLHYSNVDIVMNGGDKPGEGHTMYIHPSVSMRLKNVQFYNAINLALHNYSGSGVRGDHLYVEFDSVKTFPSNQYVLETSTNSWYGRFEFSEDNNSKKIPFKINNSNLFFYENIVPLNITDSKIFGGQSGGGNFTRCTGSLDIWGGEPTTISNCKFEGYSVIRAKPGLNLNVRSINSDFAYLDLQNVQSLTMQGGNISVLKRWDNIKKTPEKIKLNAVKIIREE